MSWIVKTSHCPNDVFPQKPVTSGLSGIEIATSPGVRAPMSIPQEQNLRWSLDFVMDTLVSGRRFRILTLVDDFTRECLTLVVDTSLTSLRVARELDRVIEIRGCLGEPQVAEVITQGRWDRVE